MDIVAKCETCDAVNDPIWVILLASVLQFFSRKLPVNQLADLVFNFTDQEKWFCEVSKLNGQICCRDDATYGAVNSLYKNILLLSTTLIAPKSEVSIETT